MHCVTRRTQLSRQWLPHSLLVVGILLILFASLPPLIRIWGAPPPKTSVKTINEYTFVGDDYPQYYPVDLGAVSFTPEDTVHYQISSNDAENEWDSIFPDGGGFLLLGPQRRAFGLSLFHQMHCLVRIRRAIGARQPSIHAHHCLNYLRQAIICEADSTIEPVVPSPGERTVYAETSRSCKDWEKVYKLVSDNYKTTSS
ncbi:uncharacterized protein TRAVEDRAFT_52938 [Trametes versicolor FP-101664 SS1]|uniref:uncharacterized protein n=1 Tax=Trametes versicolor (strain FP-101664) TaxID=717944 RepID=UPI0004622F71|nr:uncharacterized protein TRAVEDRAFT_52938 [Trametes versicolor FP-101664 SS1]EIW52494.1 hypothetical protein TRAVEDRAFT_52938 [Trametes versicolor FP-101664 SS1]